MRKEKGQLHPDSIIVEPTSGNQGIGDGLIPGILNREIYDHIYVVTDEEAIDTAERYFSTPLFEE